MMENGRGLIKALETWAKKVTVGYKDVNVLNLSTSFRDGMAFCAIIHHYRPDLINFESLSPGNIFENNSMAFSVAETQLGVPALLDAEDMVEYERPDRLSIITYLSQLRNCFENQNKVNLKKPDLKRIQNNTPGPPPKISVLQPTLLPTKRHEVCQVCKHRVFILERLIVENKLYHTTCFRCHKCDCLLNPGAYVKSDTLGFYECSVCLTDETPESPQSSVKSMEHVHEHETTKQEMYVPRSETESPKLFARGAEPLYTPQKEFTSKGAVSFAKSNLSPESLRFSPTSPIVTNSLRSFSAKSAEIKHEVVNGTGSNISVKDKINVFEKNQPNETLPVSTSTPSANKLRISFVESGANEFSSDGLSASSHFNESLEKSASDKDNSFSTKISPIRTFEKYSFSEKDSSKISEDSVDKTSEQNFDNINYSKSLSKESNSGSKISANLSQDTTLDIKNKYSIKSFQESPKVSRDIFKSSLQPLKLNFPTSIRKETTHSPESSADSEKAINIPQIKSNYSITLPRPGIGRNLSLREDTSDVKISNSESNLNNGAKLQNLSKVRRSSLESSNECGGTKSKETSSTLSTKHFNRASSVQEMGASNNYLKSSIRTYSPIYKSMLSSSSLGGASGTIQSTSESSLKSDAFNDLSKAKTNDEIVTHKILNSTPLLKNDLNVQSESSDLSNISVPKITENLEISASSKENIQESKEEVYPDDLNPFGDEEGDVENEEEEYPDDLNPFGDEEEVIDNSKISIEDYDETKNPFASDDDDDNIETPKYPLVPPKPPLFENKSPSYQDSISSSNFSSPSNSLKGTLKKRQAPKPPAISEIFPKDSNDSGLDSSFNSLKSSPASVKRNFQTPSPKLRKNKPAPPPPPSVSRDSAANVKMTKETDNLKLRSSTHSTEEKPRQAYKKKKRPAPSVPVSMRRDMKKIPLRDIILEMKEIEDKQREFERQGREIELLIRDRDKDEEPSVEEEENIMQLFELVNQKNALFRRQAELMYIKRSQRLEEQQYQIEKEIRLLMEKPESEKTDEDTQKEEELTIELIDIVDQRNSIIDSIEMDRRRELEEDHSVQEHIELKNGDLQIPAEIKQKSSSKNKKSKAEKKKEKKKQEEQESGKNTLKRKKLFSRKS